MLNLGRLPQRSPSLHTEADGAAVPDGFGPFQVLHQIGAGTLGPVFRAYDAQRERLVAVKLFRLDLPPERAHQLVGEFERLIASELGHPSLARPIAAGLVGVSPYLAVEYVNAESLDLALREYGPAPSQDGLRVVTQLAAALDFAAVVGVVHGAMHPRDVLLSADDTRITGIGIARALERAGVTPPLRRPYSAPERIGGESWDRRADVFTLAALAHEVLFGRRITGTGQHVAASLTPLPGAEMMPLQDAFARALSEDPDDRFETALEFAEALRSAFDFEAAAAAGASAAVVAPVAAEPAALPKPPPTEPIRPVVTEPQLPLEAPADQPEPLRANHVEPVRAPEPPPSVAAAPIAVAPVPAARPRVDRNELRPAKTEDLDLRAAPPVVPARIDVQRASEPSPPAPVAPAGRTRSMVWPIAAALVIGAALGFAGGLQLMSRDQPAADQAATATQVPAPADTAAAAASPAPAPRDATDVPIDTPRPVDAQGEQGGASEAPAPKAAPRPPSRAAASPRAERRPPSRAPAQMTARSRATDRTDSVTSGTVGRFVGKLNVDSRPTGAHVFLDGRLIGTTPLAVPSVPAGEHAIRLERDGYRRWSSSIRIVAAEQNRVTASLER